MSTILTDYTSLNTFLDGIGQQYRILKYIKDILNNWFSDKSNVADKRLHSMLYDSLGNFKTDQLKLGTPFNYDNQYTGTTPSIIVSLNDIHYMKKHFDNLSSLGGVGPMDNAACDFVIKKMPISVSVVTLSYDGTVLLSLLVLMFLSVNALNIVSDCDAIAHFFVEGCSAPKPIQSTQLGAAKQVYLSGISLDITSYISWKHDTQGPVFKGLSLQTNFK